MRKHWHLATQPDPERESRLLAFTATPADWNDGTADEDAPRTPDDWTDGTEDQEQATQTILKDLTGTARAGIADALQLAERQKENERQMKEKFGVFATAFNEKIKQGDVAFDIPLNSDCSPQLKVLADLFLNQYPTHQNAYRALLFENNDLQTQYVDEFTKMYNTLKAAHEALLTDLQAEHGTFVQNNMNDLRRSQIAVDAFIASKAPKPILQRLIQDRYNDYVRDAHAIIAKHETFRGTEVRKEAEKMKEKVAEHIEKVSKIIEELKVKAVKEPAIKDVLTAMNMISSTLSARWVFLNRMIERAARIEEWQAGNEKPSSFGVYAAGIARSPEDKKDLEENFKVKMQTVPNANDADWESVGNISDKTAIAHTFEDDDATAMTLRDELADIRTALTDTEGELQAIHTEEMCKQCTKALEESDAMEKNQKEGEPTEASAELSLKNKFMNAIGSLGIEFYTPQQIIKGWQLYWENRQAAKDQTNRRKGAKFGMHVSNAMKLVTPFPNYNQEIEQLMKSSMDGEDGKEKSSYIEFLKGGPAAFSELFNAGGLYYSQQHNYNRTRAILEYAAEKGWLYDINRETNTVMGIQLVTGKNISPNDDVHVYVSEVLSQMQAGGESKARKEGKERVAHEESIPPMAKVLQEELERTNYWAIEGIWDVALGKAKWGETPEYLHLILLNYMRKNPQARKYMPKNLYDQMKNHGLYGLPGSMIDRGKMYAWQKKYEHNDDAANAHLNDAGPLAGATLIIEEKIRDAVSGAGDPPVSEEVMMRLVARVLAGQVLTGIPGDISEDKKNHTWNKIISIYEDDLKEYRVFAASMKAGNILKMDDDYFDQRMGSSILLLGPEGVFNVLNKRSQRDFAEQDKALCYLGQVITRYDQLKKIADSNPGYKSALENYKKRMQINFDQWVLGNMNDASSSPFADFYTYFVPINSDGTLKTEGMDSMENGGTKGFAFAEIAKRGMISQKVLQQLADEKGKDFAKKVAKEAGNITLT